jgi:hypothetical protein
LDNYASVIQLIGEWRATADVYADPRLARRLRRPLGAEGEVVPEPTIP